MSFRIRALPLEPFRSLFELEDTALLALGARRITANTQHSAPCRVSLADATPGDALILLNHRHLDDPYSPYRGDGPILVSESAVEARPEPGEVPDILTRRLLSIRVYDADWIMTDADVVEGRDVAARLQAWFADPAAVRIHLHTARRGCFVVSAERA